MKNSMLITFVFIPVLLNVLAYGKNDFGKFRMEKINFIWSKAIPLLSDDNSRLEKLQRDLTTFDELYLSLKQDGTHFKSLDEGVEEIDRKLESLLERYELEDTIMAFRLKYKYDHRKVYGTNEENKNKITKEPVFIDERVSKLWDEAKNEQALSIKQLDDLFEDLSEHDRKLTEYNIFLKQISDLEKQTNKVDKSHNKEHEEITKAAKQMNLELENNLEKLTQRFHNLKNNPFKNPKAKELWEKALKSPSLIPNELEAIRSELRHYERQIEKMEYHREHMDEAEEFGKMAAKGKTPHHDDQMKENKNAYEKMLRKIKKLGHYLDEKLSASKTHREL